MMQNMSTPLPLPPARETPNSVLETQVSELASASPEAVLEGLLSAKGGLSKSTRQALLERLSSS